MMYVLEGLGAFDGRTRGRQERKNKMRATAGKIRRNSNRGTYGKGLHFHGGAIVEGELWALQENPKRIGEVWYSRAETLTGCEVLLSWNYDPAYGVLDGQVVITDVPEWFAILGGDPIWQR